MSEMDLAGLLLSSLFAGGAESYKLMIIASGERSQFPNVGPTDRRLKKGDLIRMEIFGQKNGYLTGVCRTAVVGDATAEQYKIWSNLIECKYLVMDLIKPGAQLPGYLPDVSAEIQRARVRAHQFCRPRHRPCTCTKNLTWGRYGNEVVQAGMVGAFEPLVYIPGDSVCRTKTCFA